MPHQCTKCGEIFPDAAEEILKGCSCGSRFFYYIRQDRIDQEQVQETLKELDRADKEQIEKDIRDITGLKEGEEEKPVILDLESVRVIRPGKFEIDIVSLFNRNRPVIYKLEEGKYIIDLSSSMRGDEEEIKKKIRDPDKIMNTEEDEEETSEELDIEGD
jgi:hypothetical protein